MITLIIGRKHTVTNSRPIYIIFIIGNADYVKFEWIPCSDQKVGVVTPESSNKSNIYSFPFHMAFNYNNVAMYNL